MAIVKIKVDRESLPKHTDEEFEEWISFCVGAAGGMKMTNSLQGHDLDRTVLIDWEDE